jgi:hypothetical protein
LGAALASNGVPGAGTDFVLNFTVAPANVTAAVSVSSGALVYNRANKTGSETFTILNTGGTAIPGPIQLVLSLNNAAVTASGNAGTYQGNAWWLISNGSLAPGASATVTVTFSYTAGTSFTTTPTVYSGGLN